MTQPLKILYTNADSLGNKLHELKAIAYNDDLDIICITETLPKNKQTLTSGGNLVLNNYTNYDCLTGRGVSLYIHERHKSEAIELNSNFTDQIWASIELTNNTKLLIGGIYRSPNSSKNNNEELVKLLDKISIYRNTDIIIMGDFNYKEIDWKKMTVNCSIQHPANAIFDKINDLFLEQIILEPTRHRQGQTANTLDWVLTNFPEKTDNVEILAPLGPKGDHNVIKFHYDMPSITIQTNTKYSYTKGDYDKMKGELKDIKWDNIMTNLDVESSWQEFEDILGKLMKKHIPHKGRKPTKKRQPWINQEVKEAIKTKNKAWKTYKQNKTDDNWTYFTKIKNNTNRIIKQAKTTYESHLANEIKTNPKQFWNYVNIKRNTNRDFPSMHDKDNNTYVTDTDKANQFNLYFSEVFTTEDTSHLPNLHIEVGNNKIEDIEISQNLLEKHLNKIDISKAAGPDQIHSRVLYELRESISYPLYNIFHKSIEEGNLPKIWKTAHVKPIHKKGKKTMFSNYRPVSLTSVCGKILERVIRDQVVKYLEDNKLLKDVQHGFRSGRSCTTQLLEIMEEWTALLDKGISFDCIYLDYAKAFDKVPHLRLLTKLEAYGIKGKLL